MESDLCPIPPLLVSETKSGLFRCDIEFRIS